MGDTQDRYTAKVIESSDITDFLEHARNKLKGNISAANKTARVLTPNNVGGYSLGAPGTGYTRGDSEIFTTPNQKVAQAASVDGAGQTLEFSPGTTLPSFNLKLDAVEKSSVTPTIPPKSDALPEMEEVTEFEGGQTFSAVINKIETEESGETIPEFKPDVFNPKVTMFPQNPEPPTVINVLTYHFGTDWVNWEPETIRQELDSRGLVARSEQDSPANRILFDCIFAAQLLYSHSGFMDFWRMYEKLCKAFNGSPVMMQEIQTTTPAEMAYFRKLINILRNDLKAEDFGTEVRKYQAACCFNSGFYVAPGVISSCQPDLDKLLASQETDEFKTNLWAVEDKLYNMDMSKFNKTVDEMQFDETPGSIQIAKHFAVVRQVREKVERIRTQLQLG